MKLLPFLLLMAAPLAGQAQFTYITNNGTITITGCTNPIGAVIIPSAINGLPVTSIGTNAFYSCTSLTGVTIPDTVTNIGSFAFEWCSGLSGLTIGTNVTNIGDDAFAYCYGLTNVTIPANVTSIGSDAFYTCIGLTNVTVSASVTNIGTSAFYDCTYLSAILVDTNNPAYSSVDGVLFNKSQTTLVEYPCGKTQSYAVPNSVTSIGDNAFAICYGLNSVTIPNSVTSIGTNAFYKCSSLTGVTIPDTVTNIGASAFNDCASLGAITVDTNNPAYSSVAGVLFNKSQNTLIQCPGGEAGTYTIPDSVNSVGDNAFSACISLTGVTIPNTITNIGDYAFSACTSLTSVAIPDSVTSIGEGVFENCHSLTSVAIPNSIASIGDWAFAFCTSLTNVTIPNSVTSIGFRAFYFCTSLTSITIGNGVTSIGDYAFQMCSNLGGVYFKGNAPSLGSDVFGSEFGRDSDSNATVYYLPGTSGWGTTFGYRPTMLWNPQAQTRDGCFGVRTNQFGFNITGTTNIPIVIEACADLSSPVWVPLQGCTLTNGSIYFCDPQWTNYPSRFYRISAQ